MNKIKEFIEYKISNLIHIFKILFPKKTKHKFLIYFLSIYHILGVMFWMYGLFLPRYLYPFYIFYLLLLFSTYYIFDNYCFLTLLSNRISGLKKSPLKKLDMSMKTGQIILVFLIYVSLVFLIFPEYSFPELGWL